jgi:NAD(P)-dependent dehydrogenase (short-subunit alcohol dehydrogenase family)
LHNVLIRTIIDIDDPPERLPLMTLAGTGLLEGRRAVVTGASRGIGAAISRDLAAAGAAVALIGRSEASLNSVGMELEVATGRRAHVVVGDLQDPSSARGAVNRSVELMGGLDILVNGAGVIERADAAVLTTTQWDRVMAVNLRGAFVAAQAAFGSLAEAGGVIVNITSLSALFGIRRAAAYGASKGGLLQLTRALALEWAASGIRVNAVAPGYVETALTEPLSRDRERYEAVRARIPLGRWGRPEDVGGTVVYLASDLAAYVTGQVIHVDGGYSCDG